MTRRTRIAAHRGGLFLWPENSARAFRESARLPIEQAECDVHLTADGEVVVMHDATLDRTTDGTGPVAAIGLAEFRHLRVRGAEGEAPPSLAEYLEILRGSPVAPRIEIKSDAQHRPYPGIVAKTLARLDAAGERRRSWIIGFDADTMAEAQATGGLAGVAWLLELRTLLWIGVEGMIAAARARGFPEVGLPAMALDHALVGRLRAAGLCIGTWGANHEASIARMLALGVDIFATDDPPLALRLRETC